MVFVTRSYDIQPKLSIDPMKSLKQIGEFHRMFDENYNDNYREYTSKERSIVIYDEEKDEWAKIDLLYCIENCQIF